VSRGQNGNGLGSLEQFITLRLDAYFGSPIGSRTCSRWHEVIGTIDRPRYQVFGELKLWMLPGSGVHEVPKRRYEVCKRRNYDRNLPLRDLVDQRKGVIALFKVQIDARSEARRRRQVSGRCLCSRTNERGGGGSACKAWFRVSIYTG